MISSLPNIEKRIEEKENKSEFIKSYDFDNSYPQNIYDIIANSGTASSCVKLYAKFINGRGFKDETFYKAKINESGLTVDSLLRFISSDFAKINGYAIHVNYNALLKISDVKFIPFEYCRLGIGPMLGKIAVYKDWASKKIDKEKIVYIDRFNPSQATLLTQINGDITTYKGQILWRSARGNDYPLAPCDSVLEDVVSDGEIKRFRLRNIRKGFSASTIIEYGYEFQDEQEREDEANNWGNFIGPDGADVILLENKNGNGEDKSIKLSKLDVTNNDKMYEVTNNTVINSIVRSYNQPRKLLNLDEKNGFATADVQADYKYYNSITEGERIMIEEDFTKIFSLFDTNINPSGDYSILPQKFESGNTELIDNYGPEIMDKIISIISSALLPEQKVNLLKVVYGLSVEQAQSLVLGTPTV